MNPKKILVYGAGPLGSLFAARLYDGGHDVSLLARGKRLEDLRQHRVMLKDFYTGEVTSTPVRIVEVLAPDDAYDLVLVIMRKRYALDILPTLAANKHTPNILFLMNNVSGPGPLVDALGDRALIGFPGAAGMFEEHVIHHLYGSEAHPGSILFGEVNGQITERAQEIASILEQGVGFDVDLRDDMDTWLKYHVAMLMPTMAPALFAAGNDLQRMANTRDALVLTVRGMREGFRALKALGLPVTPSTFRMYMWLPEPLLIAVLRKRLVAPEVEVALAGHADAIRDTEVVDHVNEFKALIKDTGVKTPCIDTLAKYLDRNQPLMPEGSQELRLRW